VSLALFSVLWFRLETPSSIPRILRLSLDLPRGVTLSDEYSAPFAIAPAGSPLVLLASEAGKTRLYLRSLDDVAIRPLPGTEEARQPFFSPDGRWVAFFAERKLEKVPVDGGPVLPLCEMGSNARGATWAAGGTIVFAPSQRSGLERVSDRGGRPVALTTLDTVRDEYSHRWPDVLPGGAWVLFTVAVEEAFSFDEARLDAVSLETGERRTILNGAAYGRYLGGGQLAFVRAGRVYSVGFDPERLEVHGAPEVMLGGVRYEPQNGATHLAVSTSGVLAYGPGVPTSQEHYLSWLDREGRLKRLLDTPRMFRDPRLGPDGQRVAVLVGPSAESDLWLVEADGTLTQLSFGLSPHRPTWTADGKRITVAAVQGGTWRLLSLPADGKGETSLLLEGKNRVYPNAWSPDGRYLVFQEERPQTGWDLLILEVDAAGRPKGPPQPLAASPFHETNASLSADGRWVTYESDEIDALVQAYVRSFPDGGHKVRASTTGARWPSWGRGRELFYYDTSRHGLDVARTREEGGRLLVEAGQPIWDDHAERPPALGRVVVTVTGARFNVHPADDRFLVLETSAAAVEPFLSRPVIVLGPARPER
jgi:serine/threonine-protein kinase